MRKLRFKEVPSCLWQNFNCGLFSDDLKPLPTLNLVPDGWGICLVQADSCKRGLIFVSLYPLPRPFLSYCCPFLFTHYFLGCTHVFLKHQVGLHNFRAGQTAQSPHGFALSLPVPCYDVDIFLQQNWYGLYDISSHRLVILQVVIWFLVDRGYARPRVGNGGGGKTALITKGPQPSKENKCVHGQPETMKLVPQMSAGREESDPSRADGGIQWVSLRTNI